MATDTTTMGEDYLLERKSKNDLKDLLKTLVAFANSVRPGHVARILIGERDDGMPEDIDPDAVQKAVRKEADKIYPPIIWRSAVYEKTGKQCVRVEVEHSGDTPHFAGPAWVRRGSETVAASADEFQRLIDLRSSITFELDQWIGRPVTLEQVTTFENQASRAVVADALLKFVNRFYATLEFDGKSHSYPLKTLTICWDDGGARLKLSIEQPRRILHTPRIDREVES
jgi:predicted HTH transcriptional regulator